MATAKIAVLNASDLAGMLTSSDVVVQSGSKAEDVELKAALSWATGNQLTIDAFHSIAFDKLLEVSGTGGLTLITNDSGSGGRLSFNTSGRITFWDLSSNLMIDGASYTLVGDIMALASDVASDPSGHYALAASYDAVADGIYSSSPIQTTFTGTFEGLGNTIVHLSVNDPTDGDWVGFFSRVGSGGVIENIILSKATIAGDGILVGALTAFNEGTINHSLAKGHVSTNITNAEAFIGGLVGLNSGSIVQSGTAVSVSGSDFNFAGGFVGVSSGTIAQSYATGRVLAGSSGAAGGLVGGTSGTVAQSYAIGSASGGSGSSIGGLIARNSGTVVQAYSIGTVSGGGPSGYRGGLIGYDEASSGSISSAYWDLDTSGIDNPDRGAGKPKNDPGITGLTDDQLKAGLPSGFDPAVWAEDPSINGGYPYLIANPTTN